MVLTGLCPREPQDSLEKARKYAYKLARYIASHCNHKDDLENTVVHSRLQGMELANVLRDLADAYEGMVEAMHYEHDESVKFMRETTELRDELREQKEIYQRLIVEHDKGWARVAELERKKGLTQEYPDD